MLYDPEEFKIIVEGEEMRRIVLSIEHGSIFPKSRGVQLTFDHKSDMFKPLEVSTFDSLKIQSQTLI